MYPPFLLYFIELFNSKLINDAFLDKKVTNLFVCYEIIYTFAPL